MLVYCSIDYRSLHVICTIFSLAATDVDQQHRREAELNDMSHDVSMHTDVSLAFIRASTFGV